MKWNRTESKKALRKAALLLLGACSTVACGAPRANVDGAAQTSAGTNGAPLANAANTPAGSASAVPPAGAPAATGATRAVQGALIGSINASAETTKATGIARWDIHQGETGYGVAGVDAKGSPAFSAYAKPEMTKNGKTLGVVLDDSVMMAVDPKSGKVVNSKVRGGGTAKANLSALPYLGADIRGWWSAPYGCGATYATSFVDVAVGLGGCATSLLDGAVYCDDVGLGMPVTQAIAAYDACTPVATCGVYGSCDAICGGYGYGYQAAFPDCSCYCEVGNGYDDYGYDVVYDDGWDYGDEWWYVYDDAW